MTHVWHLKSACLALASFKLGLSSAFLSSLDQFHRLSKFTSIFFFSICEWFESKLENLAIVIGYTSSVHGLVQVHEQFQRRAHVPEPAKSYGIRMRERERERGLTAGLKNLEF